MNPVVVVGGSLAGLTTVEELRRSDYAGPIIVIEPEVGLAYDRPPLSKQVLSGSWPPERAFLWTAEEVSDLKIDLRSGASATSLDLSGKRVGLSTGESLTYRSLVIATGLSPRRAPYDPLPGNVRVLRTMSDAKELGRALQGGPRLVVVGAGFLGLEVAATARTLGCEVTVVEPQSGPLAAIVSQEMADLVVSMHRDAGVELRWGASVVGFPRTAGGGTGPATGVELDDGETIPADVVFLAIGGVAAVDWLQDSGLDIRNGVRCDEFGEAAPDVFAAGDVANWFHRDLGTHLRLEHRTNAVEQATAVAFNMLASPHERKPFAPLPYIWSDQFDARLQFYGLPRASDTTRVLVFDPDKPRLVVAHGKAGRISGVVGMNAGRAIRDFLPLVRDRAPWTLVPSA